MKKRKKAKKKRGKKESNSFLSIITRYFLALAVSYNGLFIFYYLFTPITLYAVYFVLNLFFDATLEASKILFSGFAIELIPACIAGSAYYLLFVLNMIIPNINYKKRIRMIAFAFASLLVLNILRISILGIVASYDLLFFSLAHKVFWYFLNIIMVVVIWFAEVFIFNIKAIPFYTDLKYLCSSIKHKN